MALVSAGATNGAKYGGWISALLLSARRWQLGYKPPELLAVLRRIESRGHYLLLIV